MVRKSGDVQNEADQQRRVALRTTLQNALRRGPAVQHREPRPSRPEHLPEPEPARIERRPATVAESPTVNGTAPAIPGSEPVEPHLLVLRELKALSGL